MAYKIMFMDKTVKKFDSLKGADLEGADLEGVDLKGAILIGADLTGADLKGADLTGADLTGADLRWANLTGADLTGTCVKVIKASKDTIFYHKSDKYPEGDLVKIGCKEGSLNWWIQNYKTVGKNNRYTEGDITEYGQILNSLTDK